MKTLATVRTCALFVGFTAVAATIHAASVGDTVIWRNSGTMGASSRDENADTNICLRLLLRQRDGLPNGSIVNLAKISLGSRNASFNRSQESGADASMLQLYYAATGYYTSDIANGTDSFSGETICAKGQYAPRLSYAFNGAEVSVGNFWYDICSMRDNSHWLYRPGFKSIQAADASTLPSLFFNKSNLYDRGIDPVYEITATVVSLGAECDTTATVSGNASLSRLSWTAPITTDGTQWATIQVTDNATLVLDKTTNFKLLTLSVAQGKTLTLSGANALTATKIEISGKGKVAPATAALSGNVIGCGNLVYTNALPSSATVFDYNWCGTLKLENLTTPNGLNLSDYGNEVSTIVLSGVTGWLNYGTHGVSVHLEDGGYGFALKLTDGYSPQRDDPNRCTVINRVFGSGTIIDGIAENGKAAFPVIKIYDAIDFDGSILLDRANILFCDQSTTYSSLYGQFDKTTTNGVLRIDGGRGPTLARGKTWSVNVYDDDDDPHGLVVFEKGDGVLGGGELNVTLNGAPLNTDRYAVRLRKGKVLIREIFGLRLRLF